MRALVISPQPFFSPRGTPFSVYYRTMVTAELGIDIDLLTYGEGQDVDLPGVKIHRIPRFAFLGPVKTGPSALKLFLDVFLFFKTLSLLIRNRYDFVHAHEEAVFYCRFLKPLFRFKLVYDMHSSLPQQLTNFNFSKSRLLIGLFKKLEDSAIHAADAVITICPALADYVDGLITDKGKHLLIENSIFDPVKLSASPDSTPSKQSPEDKLIELPKGEGPLIVYAGTLEHYQGIDLLIEGFAQALKQQADLRMIIAGGSEKQVGLYRSMVNKLGLDEQCVLTGRVPQKIAKQLMGQATVLASPRTEGDNTPLKVYELLASGIPMIATDIYSHNQVLDDAVAFMVEPTAAGFCMGMLAATANDGEAQRRVSGALALYENKYSRKMYETKMRALLDRISCAV